MTRDEQSESAQIEIAAVGDVLISRPDPDQALAEVSTILRTADITFGNCEGAYSDVDEPNPEARAVVRGKPSSIGLLADAGFDVMSQANNHALDWGIDAMLETRAALAEHGVIPLGAGADRSEAFAPVIVEHGGVRVAFVTATCVFPPGYGATDDTPGCATLDVETIYTCLNDPGTAPQIETVLTPASAAAVVGMIEEVRDKADVVVAALHWGLSVVPAKLAAYETELGRLAIDSGADIVLGNHQHIVKGVQFYKGKPILHGMGNFVLDMPPLEKLGKPGALQKKNEAYGEYALGPRAGYPTYPWHPESRWTMIAHIAADRGGLRGLSLTPCLINQSSQPVPLADGDSRIEEFRAYLEDITLRAGLSAEFVIHGDRIQVNEPSEPAPREQIRPDPLRASTGVTEDRIPRHQLGCLVPTEVNDYLYYQFYNLAPPGCLLIPYPLGLNGLSVPDAQAALAGHRQGLEFLAKRGVDRICLSGLPVSAYVGRRAILEFIEAAQHRYGIPVTSTFEDSIAALQHLGVERVAVAAKWDDELLALVSDYLADAEIDVVSAVGKAHTLQQTIEVNPREGIDLASQLGEQALMSSTDADGLLLGGGGWLSLMSIVPLEAKFGVPVVTNPVATCWAALRQFGERSPALGWGQLIDGLEGVRQRQKTKRRTLDVPATKG